MLTKGTFSRPTAVALPSLVVLLAASPAPGSHPDPALSTVPHCITMAPDGQLVYRVTIVGSSGPIADAQVEIRFTSASDTLVCWCNSLAGPRPRSFTAQTNAIGVATFFLSAGGCIEKGLAAIPGPQDFAAEVFAEGIKMQECGTVSPDALDATGHLASEGHGPDGTGQCAVGISDAVRYTANISANIYDWCNDLNCDGLVGIADGVIFTEYVSFSSACDGTSGP